MHTAKILSFVNERRSGRVPDIFVNYYKIRETGLETGIDAVLISHGLEPIRVLADAMSKEHDYGIIIDKQ